MCKAEQLARKWHSGQKDKAGKPYIEHLTFVVAHLDERNQETETVAWLHDSVEDTSATLKDIQLIFGKTVAEAVNAITKRRGESYADYLCRVKSNPIARIVKLSDLKHNSDLSRLSQITDRDLKRKEKYLKAIQFLRA